jgi:hypothetical protein
MQVQPITRGVYGVFLGSKQSPLVYNRRKAIAFARKNPGAMVYGMSRESYREGRYPYGWDGPTFRIMATRIY